MSESEFHQNNVRKIAKTYWQYARNYPRYLIGMGVVLPVALLMHQFLPPLVVATILNRLSNGEFTHGDLWGSFGWLILLYALFRMSSATIVWRLVIIWMDRMNASIQRDIATHIFGHLLRQSPGFHADRFSGTLVAQTNNFLAAYTRLTEAAVLQFVPLILSFIFASVVLLPRAPLFVVLLIVLSIIYAFITSKGTRIIRQKSGQAAAAQSNQTGHLADTIANVLAVKSFARTSHEQKRFNRIADATYHKMLDHADTNNHRELHFSIFTSTITTLSLVIALASVVLFDANIATAFLVIDYSATIVTRLWQFSAVTLRDVNRSFGEANDMVTILQTEPDVAEPKHPIKPQISKGEISFDNVTFTHIDTRDALFTDFSLHIPAGKKIGLVGRSGAGKSTFAKLLLRFADIEGGHIRIDGQDISQLAQDDLRRHIAYVPQEPLLFHRTIRENIAYGRPEASDSDIVTAAKRAHAHEFITAMPKGYDTLVGEHGIKLSGGQRQRIAIARAILKDAPILVLDEATSALDSESERLIQSALGELMEGRTAVIIAHRLSTIQSLDSIVVLEQGKVIEQGNHGDLLAHNGVYASLWLHQTGGFIADEDTEKNTK
ncbi:MAG TPA: ABC transporter ATP-binding protein [Candidatus Saccharimonadales bacterium]